MKNKESKRNERISPERMRYFGQTKREVIDQILAANGAVFKRMDREGTARQIYYSIRENYGALTYLAEVYAARAGEKARTISEDGIDEVRRSARLLLAREGRLPNEIHDEKHKRDPDYSRNREILFLGH